MGKIYNKIRKVESYGEVFRQTSPAYWAKYIKNNYFRRKDNIEKYKRVPEHLEFQALDVDIRGMKEYIESDGDLMKNLVNAANKICDGNTLVYGHMTQKIKGMWSTDQVTGYEWPMVSYKIVRKITPQGTLENHNDIKFPWELSNSHFLVTLAQAYIVTKNDRYYKEFLSILDNWMKENPVAVGVNWCCTMDVALRAVNIIVAASIFSKEKSDFFSTFSIYSDLLYTHMLFIRDNIEYGFVRENHYLSDIVGLKMLSQSFPNNNTAQQIYKFASRSLRQEIRFQICEDGVDHEASTCYHCFVLELFLVGLLTDKSLFESLSNIELDRLFKMHQFSYDLCDFDTYPIVGDNDSGRVLKLSSQGDFRKDIMNAMGYLLNIQGTEKNIYSYLSTEKYKNSSSYEISQPDYISREYKNGGFLILKNNNFKLLLHAGSIGRKGKGGHGHNDQTSFVLDIKGHSVIIDPGTIEYERDLEQRHIDRCTSSHNCISLNGYEQNKILKTRPFKMDNETKAKFSIQGLDENSITAVATHYGYRREFKCVCQREIIFLQKEIEIKDSVVGDYYGKYSLKFCFADNIRLKRQGNIVQLFCDELLLGYMEIASQLQFDIVTSIIGSAYENPVETQAIIITDEKTDYHASQTIKFKL